MPTPNKNIIIGNLRQDIRELVIAQNHYIVSDEFVVELYPELFLDVAVFSLPSGEKTKTLQTVESIVLDMLDRGCNRNTTLVSIGGGVVSDVAGFVASIFMRGIEWVCVPTTLLSQVDAGIGGKTAVNIQGYKNTVGAFCLPKTVLCDINILATLNSTEWLSGMGEILKTALLNAELWQYLNQNLQALFDRDWAVIHKVVDYCISIKSQIVSLDPKEAGIRRNLNIGHTLGHALESCDNFARGHGEYVMQGIQLETDIFAEHIEQHYLDEIRYLLKEIMHYKVDYDAKKLVQIASHDKKNNMRDIVFVLPISVGQTKQVKIDQAQLLKRLKSIKNIT